MYQKGHWQAVQDPTFIIEWGQEFVKIIGKGPLCIKKK